MSPKTLGTIAFVGIAIAARIFFATPRYHLVGQGTQAVPEGQAYIAEMHVTRSLKAKLTMTSTTPFTVYWLNGIDHRAVQSGNLTDLAFVDHMHQQTIGADTTAISDREIHLPQGDCYIYFEPADPSAADENADAEASDADADAVAEVEPAKPGVSRSFTYEIHEWR